MDRVTDAVDCFHQMTNELNLPDEHSEWVLGGWSAHLETGVIDYVMVSFRLQAPFRQEPGAPRRYSNGCRAV